MSTLMVDERAARAHEAVADEWPAVWFTLVEQPWSSLALLPAHPDQSTRRAAERLAEVARDYDERPVHVLSGERLTPDAGRELVHRIAELAAHGDRVLVALASPLTDVGAIPIARAADASVLLVPLNVGRAGAAQRTLSLVGEQRFIGAIVVDGPRPSVAASARHRGPAEG